MVVIDTEDVCLFVVGTPVSTANTAEPIKMLFGAKADVCGPKEPCKVVGLDPPTRVTSFLENLEMSGN